jgi:hypothetical protein
MENEILDTGLNASSVNGGLSLEDKNYLDATSKWARFLGIFGFVISGIILLVGIVMMSLGSSLGSMMGEAEGFGAMGMLGPVLGIIYLLMALPSFFMSWYTYKFGVSMKQGLYTSDATKVTEGFKNLRNLFRLYGWLVAAMLILYAVLFIAGGAMTAMR